MFYKLRRDLKDYLENPITNKKTPKFILLAGLRNLNKYIWYCRSSFSEFVYDIFRGPSHFYYKWCYRKKILSSKPITCAKESELEIHILTCKKDFLNMLWSLKSFFYYSRLRPRLIIHDDGTLKENHARILSEHFINCNVVMKKESDVKMKERLKEYKYCTKYRFEPISQLPTNIFAIRLFDFFFYSKNNKVLWIDPDILFFDKPREINLLLNCDKGFFMGDCYDSYAAPIKTLKDILGLEIVPKANAGLLYFPGKLYGLELFEELINKMYNLGDIINPFFIDQTILAAIFFRYKERFVQLGGSYQLANQDITDKTICCHFVAGLGNNFYCKGLRHLKKQQFLKNLSLLKDRN